MTCSPQKGGTQYLPSWSQLNDAEWVEHRHGARPRSRHNMWCTHGSLACPADKRAKNNFDPNEQRATVQEDNILHIRTVYTIRYLKLCCWL